MSVMHRLSRALVRLYPRAWRERYGDELLGLLADRGADWRDAADLARGCAREWARSAAAPAPGSLLAAIVPGARSLAALIVGTAVLTWLATALGDALHAEVGAVPSIWVPITYGALAALSIRVVIALYEPRPAWSFARKLGTAEAAGWLGVIFGGVLVQQWAGSELLNGGPYNIGTFLMPLSQVMIVFLSTRHHAWLSIRQSNLFALRRILSESRERLDHLERLTRLGLASTSTLSRARADHVALVQHFGRVQDGLRASVPRHPIGLGGRV
jgi:hypothetical protein